MSTSPLPFPQATAASVGPVVPLPPGVRIDRFIVEQTLHQGSHGFVYRVREAGHQQPLVLAECFPRALAIRQPDGAVRARQAGDAIALSVVSEAFVQDARAMAAIDHPGVVKVYGVINANRTVYRLMPYIDGRTLEEQRLERAEPPTVGGLVRLYDKLLDALEALHKAGFVHGLVQPDQIIMKSDNNAPVLLGMDGVSMELGEVTMSPWAAPEQQQSLRFERVNASADLYMLAATMCFAATGAAPPRAEERLAGEAWDPQALLADVTLGGGDAPALRDHLIQAVSASLALAAAARPQRADDVRHILHPRGGAGGFVASSGPVPLWVGEVPDRDSQWETLGGMSGPAPLREEARTQLFSQPPIEPPPPSERQRLFEPPPPSEPQRLFEPAPPVEAPPPPVEAQPPRVEAQPPRVEAQPPRVEAQTPRFEPQPRRFEPQPPSFEPQQPRFEPQSPAFEPQSPAFEPQQPRFQPPPPSFEPQQPRFEPQQPRLEPQSPAFEPHRPHRPSFEPQPRFEEPPFEEAPDELPPEEAWPEPSPLGEPGDPVVAPVPVRAPRAGAAAAPGPGRRASDAARAPVVPRWLLGTVGSVALLVAALAWWSERTTSTDLEFPGALLGGTPAPARQAAKATPTPAPAPAPAPAIAAAPPPVVRPAPAPAPAPTTAPPPAVAAAPPPVVRTAPAPAPEQAAPAAAPTPRESAAAPARTAPTNATPMPAPPSTEARVATAPTSARTSAVAKAAPKPAAKPVQRSTAPPRTVASADALCANRTQFSYLYCMQEACARPALRGSAQCATLRRNGDIR